MSNGRAAWKLNSFLDSLILELDRAQDTLAIKGINRRLTYTVRDLSLELHLFPEFDGSEIRFTTAKPGESGAAKVAFQLGSITDRQIRETTREPITEDDVAIEAIEGIDEETKTTLQKIGVKSARDVERMKNNNVDLREVSDNRVDYNRLAQVVNRARRQRTAPTVRGASLSPGYGSPEPAIELIIEGSNLATGAAAGEFPVAFLNDQRVDVVAASEREVRMAVREELVRPGANELTVLLDPYAVLSMELRS